jgi:subtilisin family serine protease
MSLLCAAGVASALASDVAAARGQTPAYSVAYAKPADLRRAVGDHALVVRRIPALGVAEIRTSLQGFAARARRLPGIRSVQRIRVRRSATEPALLVPPGLGSAYEWQFADTRANAVPAWVLRAASSVTIAVIDTGADVNAPDLAAKSPQTYDIHTGGFDVTDANGHGTFVSSIAAGSVTNGDGVAGFGGDARLLVIRACTPEGMLTDVDEARAIVYAVDHGARVINLSVGGPTTSFTEEQAISYAALHGVLVVAAAGNEHQMGNPIEYPAALLQPVGSDGRGGVGLAVGASTSTNGRAFFSNTGSEISLAAPGQNVFGAVSALAPSSLYPRFALPGSVSGSYGFASGTSFSAPEVAGAAALVLAANPFLRLGDVTDILKRSASGHGSWTPALGYGVLDVGAAVALALERPAISASAARKGRTVRLSWTSNGAGPFRVTRRIDGHAPHVVIATTRRMSATIVVRRHHRYVFTVSAMNADGAAATSSSVTVRG